MSDFNTLLAVRDLMTPNIITASRDASVADAARILADHNIGSVALTNGDGQLVGILTESDIVRKVVAEAKDPAATNAGEVMNEQVHQVAGSSSIFEARQAMADLGVKHLIVEEDGKPVGLLSSSALLGG